MKIMKQKIRKMIQKEGIKKKKKRKMLIIINWLKKKKDDSEESPEARKIRSYQGN